MSAIPESMVIIALQHLWQSVFYLVIVVVALRACPRITSEVRSWVWLSAFALAVIMPFAVFLPAADEGVMFKGALFGTLVSGAENEANSVNIYILLYYLAAIIWITGSMISLLQFGKSAFHTGAIIRGARILPENITGSVRTLGRKIPVFCSDQISSPLVTGFRQQIILLPQHTVVQLSPAELSSILHHEYGHIQRNDVRIMVIQKLLSAIFWWNPVLHIMVKKLNKSREMACDERAVLTTGDVRKYTRSLLSSAEKIILTQHPLTVGIFQSKKNLTERIERLKAMNITKIKLNRKSSFLWSAGIIFIAASTGYIYTARLAVADHPSMTSSEAAFARTLLPTSKISPVYPKKAIEQKLEGDVVLKFDITRQGKTINNRIYQSTNKIFNQSALDASRKFSYKSGADGTVLKNVLYKISFRLN